ncbi:hypothetical protein Salat_1522300 [Sesamum alatum]|uniref:Transposase MuDR plant domain-containing protein n=1 Tax=Sesamum alatum TaxID=300844 RepID=A0AAE2CMN8_9LAMI|nr:hypothetical protein Salat_1522300 [Sesamum alatum]
MRLVAHFLGEEVEVGVELSRGYTLGQLFRDVCASITGLNMGEVGDFYNLVGIYGLLPSDEKMLLTSQSDLDKLMEMYSSLNVVNMHVYMYMKQDYDHEVDKHNHEAEEVQVAMTNLDDEILSSEDEPEIDMGMQLDVEDIDLDDLVVVDSEDGDECSHDYEQLVGSDDEIEPVMARVSDKMAGSLFKRNDVDLIEFEVGQIFNDVQHFKDTLADYKVQEGFEMKRMHNTRKKQTACCKAEGCYWRIHASTWIDGTTFKVKTYSGPHTCKMTEKSKGASSSWIAQKYEKAFKTYQSNLTIDDLNASLVQDYGPKFRALYWTAVKAFNEDDFKNAMVEMRHESEKAWEWMMSEEPFHWSRHAFDEHVKIDQVTNNISASHGIANWVSIGKNQFLSY